KGVETYGRVGAADRVAKERRCSICRVAGASSVSKKRTKACCRILICPIRDERLSAYTRLEVARRETFERIETNCRIECACRKVQECVLPLGCVAVGVAAIRCRRNRSRSR